MSNLLERASVVLTPTAYNNGEALCIKPDDASGDFQFSRNSAATRVNAQGLVENVQILSSNLVQNGDFSEEGAEEVSNGSFSQEGAELVTNGSFDTDSNWNKQTSNWTISNGYAVCDGLQTTNSSLFQDLAVVNGNSYRIDFTITDSANDLNLILGATTIGQYGDGTHTVYVEKDSGGARVFFQATASNAFQGSIDNVSCVEVGQDWVIFGTGWSFGEDKIVSVNGSNYGVHQSAIVSGKTYKITYEVKDYVSGSFSIRANTASGSVTASANGTYTDYITSNGTLLRLMGNGTFNGSITNISVKEVGMDWEFNSTAILTANGMNIITGGFIRQDVVTIGKSYKLTYDIVSYTSGNIRVYDGTDQGSIPTSVGSNTFNFTAGGSVFYIQSNSVNVNLVITNISVIEITDDTNLPRINYEGFSYQDALGSELVVNGGFDTDTAWVKGTGWSISGGKGIATNTSIDSIYQNVLTLSKSYKASFTISSIENGSLKIGIGINFSQEFTEVGTYTYYGTPSNDGLLRITPSNGTNATIDNVSVKEYFGQEVVPNSGCGSWLWEPQSTNLITQSELFSDATWTDVGLTINNNASVSPEGVFNATKIIATTANSRHDLKTNLATANGTDMVSCFVKKSGYNYVQIASWGNPSSYVNFDLTNGLVGSIGTTPPTNYGIKDYGNGWYRIYANVLASGSGIVGIGIVTSASAGWAQSFIGNGIDGIEIWGAQVEAGNISSYIPTSGSQVTRNQDVCTNGGTGTGLINSTEGVLYAEIAALSNENQTNRYITISSGSTSNRMILRYTNTGVSIYIIANGTGALSSGFDFADRTQTIKAALRWANNDVALFVDGIKRFQGNSFTTYSPNTLNRLNMASVNGSSFPFFGKTKAVAVWKEALSDSELQSLTTI